MTKIDQLRKELIGLRKQRRSAQKEKGLAAEHNKDIRENADYDYWLQIEQNLTVRIKSISAEIEKIYKK